MASAVISVVSWFQRTVPWSNSSRAWLERLAFATLVTATTALVVFTSDMPLWSVVVAWGVLLVLFGLLLRQGWVFIFGPILFYDLVRSSRRLRTYVIRFLYIVTLFFVLCMWYLSWENQQSNRYGGRPTTVADVAQFTSTFFTFFVSIQMGLIVLLTPAYMAGSISDEKERKTMEFILATDLRSRE